MSVLSTGQFCWFSPEGLNESWFRNRHERRRKHFDVRLPSVSNNITSLSHSLDLRAKPLDQVTVGLDCSNPITLVNRTSISMYHRLHTCMSCTRMSKCIYEMNSRASISFYWVTFSTRVVLSYVCCLESSPQC